MAKDITAMMFRATDIEVTGTVIIIVITIEEATAAAAVTAHTSFIFPAK